MLPTSLCGIFGNHIQKCSEISEHMALNLVHVVLLKRRYKKICLICNIVLKVYKTVLLFVKIKVNSLYNCDACLHVARRDYRLVQARQPLTTRISREENHEPLHYWLIAHHLSRQWPILSAPPLWLDLLPPREDIR